MYGVILNLYVTNILVRHAFANIFLPMQSSVDFAPPMFHAIRYSLVDSANI